MLYSIVVGYSLYSLGSSDSDSDSGSDSEGSGGDDGCDGLSR